MPDRWKGVIIMVKCPAVGGSYWMIVDIWEVEVPAPVTLISEDDGVFVARWQISEEFAEDYDGIEAQNLFSTKEAAWLAIRTADIVAYTHEHPPLQ